MTATTPAQVHAMCACPFCGVTDFDLVGLKHHLERGHCDAWNETPWPPPRCVIDACKREVASGSDMCEDHIVEGNELFSESTALAKAAEILGEGK